MLLLLLFMLQWAGVLIMPVGIFGIIISRMRQALLRKELARIAAAPVGAKLHKILPLQVRFCRPFSAGDTACSADDNMCVCALYCPR
jgi:hypothetical protein